MPAADEMGGARTDGPPNQSSIIPPQISSDNLFAFAHAHFSDEALSHFTQVFLTPASQNDGSYQEEQVWEEVEDDDDDLGYYEDGVKRTLTNEQIAIFRHSELRELRRQQEKQRLKEEDKSTTVPDDPITVTTLETSVELEKSNMPTTFKHGNNSSKKKKGLAKRTKNQQKPDLRKRTWDKVDKGLDTLNYD